VRCGESQTVTGPSGVWSLRLTGAEAGEVRFEGASTATRQLAAGSMNVLMSWRMPDAKDVAAATRLVADAQVAGLSPEIHRQRLAALLGGTLMSALDDGLAAQVASLTAPLRDEFEFMRGRLMTALNEDAAVFRTACVTARKPWGGSMSTWFGEAERLGRLRAAVLATLAAPEAARVKAVRAALSDLSKARATCQDPVFLSQYDTWTTQLAAALPVDAAKPEKPEKPEKR